jgi:hypothetical protein
MSPVVAVRLSALTAAIVAVVTAIPPAMTGMNPFYFGDAVILAFLAWGASRRSRTAAVGLVIYWTGSKAVQLVVAPGLLTTPTSAVIALVVLAIFIAGMAATFSLHRQEPLSSQP